MCLRVESGGKVDETDPQVDEGTKSEYIGMFRFSLDAKNRVSVPAKWKLKDQGGEFLFAWPNSEGWISVFPPKARRELDAKLSTVRASDKVGQRVLRRIYGVGTRIGCDASGRIVLSKDLLAHAGVDLEAKAGRPVVFVGTGETFQIWSEEAFEAEQEAAAYDEAVNSKVQELGI